MAAKVTIQVGYGELVTALWCPHCLKPSGYRLPVYWLKTTGVSSLGTVHKCHDCGAAL